MRLFLLRSPQPGLIVPCIPVGLDVWHCEMLLNPPRFSFSYAMLPIESQKDVCRIRKFIILQNGALNECRHGLIWNADLWKEVMMFQNEFGSWRQSPPSHPPPILNQALACLLSLFILSVYKKYHSLSASSQLDTSTALITKRKCHFILKWAFKHSYTAGLNNILM